MERFLGFRLFSTRLLVLFLGLLAAALATTYVRVAQANREIALAHSADRLGLGARFFDNAVHQRIDLLAGQASAMTSDYAIRQVLLNEQPDVATLETNLQNFSQRIGAPVVALFNPSGELLANNTGPMAPADRAPFEQLIHSATNDDLPMASGFSYQGQELHVLVVLPLYAPFPNVVDWFGLPFPIDRDFAGKIKDTTDLEVTFVSAETAGQPRVLASTLPAATAQEVALATARASTLAAGLQVLDLPGERYVTLFKSQPILGGTPITIVLQRPLSAELAPAHSLEKKLLGISLVALVVAAVVAYWIARGVSQPLLSLAQHTRLIARGDYETHFPLERADEVGQLATAVNRMSSGLAERDRVRDLLDKNVSPKVAEQLMRDGAALGGEERDVTVVFVDLRGFSTLSENLSPPALIALLNRFLDRMSHEIEQQGGIVDKYIGDAIMALFGAPVNEANAAGRALSAALAMERALVSLNHELAAEGRAGLAIGVGINTARVVAGNIGSHRRLNYSVIGDGVNVASRLQSLTRVTEYHTSIIASAATVAAAEGKFRARPLGTVPVKGRTEPVEIFAIEPVA